jgi:outer membrane protein TolC
METMESQLLLNPKPAVAVIALTVSIAFCTSAVWAQQSTPPPLRPAIPAAKKATPTRERKSYSAEIHLQDSATPVGKDPVKAVPPSKGESPTITGQFPDSAPENSVDFTASLPLQALVRVENTLNPFALDADRIEAVTYREVLLAAETGNLDILGTKYGALSAKDSYLSAVTQYLPDITLAYNKYAINAFIPVPVAAVVPTGSIGAGTVSAKTTATIIDTPVTVMSAGFTVPIWQTSRLVNLLSQKHNLRATRAQLTGTTNDTLLTAANNYYNVLLNQALLEIREKAVRISEEQLRMNSSLEESGLATNLDVLQSRAQLARDRQNLVDQQRIRRNSSIQLAHTLNANLGQDLVPSEPILRKARLISKTTPVQELLRLAIDNRPELKQYDELRQVAKAAIYTAIAPMTPNVTLGGNIYGVGQDIGNLGHAYVLNFGVKWTFGGLGLTEIENAKSAKWHARQTLVDANKQFLNVFDQVRTSFNDGLSAERRIDQAIDEINAAEEELRLARIRLETGLGINIDVLNAQRDLTQARVDKAQAIADFNIAQAQLLHNIGLISVDNLTSGRLISSAPTQPTR